MKTHAKGLPLSTVGGLALVLVLDASPAGAVPVLETFVLAIAGQATLGPGFQCATSGTPAPVWSFFGAAGPSIPADGLVTCDIAGGFNFQSGAAGPLSDGRALAVAFAPFDPKSFDGSAAATADYGVLRSRSDGTFLGSLNSFVHEGTESFAKFRETLTIASPGVASGSPGWVRLWFTVGGSITVTGPPPGSSVGDFELMYQHNAGPIYLAIRAQVVRSDVAPSLIAGTSDADLSGFVVGPGSLSGSGIAPTFSLPIVFGTPFDLTVGLLTYAVPATSATVDADFSSTAVLSRIEVRDSGGQMLSEFSVASGSGTGYDASGVLLDLDDDGFTDATGDCDDEDPSVFPGAPEACNATDDDCDGAIDEGEVCGVHDLAVASLRVPKRVALKANQPSNVVAKVIVQNRSPHLETISDMSALASLVRLRARSLHPDRCPDAAVQIAAKQRNLPATLKPKASLPVAFEVTFDCAVDPAASTKRDPGHEDFEWEARVDHAVLDGILDTHPVDDECPRAPTGPDPNPDGKITDKGCPTVTTDVFSK